MTISASILGFLRAIIYVIITAVLSWLAVQANIAPFFGDTIALLVTALAASLEHYIQSQNGKALFGAVRSV